MNKQYKPKEIEERIYESWEKTKSFLAKESTSKFSIVFIVFHTHIGPTIADTPIEIAIEYQIQTISYPLLAK